MRMICSSRFCRQLAPNAESNLITLVYLESLILKHTLDGSVFAGRRKLGLKDDAEGTVADNFALGILHFLGFTSETILDFFANNFCHAVSRSGSASTVKHCAENDCLPPSRKPENPLGRLEDILRFTKFDGDLCYR